MINFIKRMLRGSMNTEPSGLSIQDFKSFHECNHVMSQREAKKRRYRSHSLVAGDRVMVSKLVEVTRLGDLTKKLTLIKREGIVIKASNGFNHEILFDDDNVPTQCNHTYHIRLITEQLTEGDEVSYTSRRSLEIFGGNTRWYNATIENVYSPGSYLIKTEKGYFHEHSEPEYIFKRITHEG